MYNASKILFIAGGIIIVISLLPKSGNFLDVRRIIIEHFKLILKNPLQFFSVFCVPGMFSVALVLIKNVDANILNNLMIVLSIVIAMFFAVLSILTTFEKKEDDKNYEKTLDETFTATLFEIVLGVFLLTVSFVTMAFAGNYEASLLLKIISGVIYYFTIVIMLNIFIVIKRVHALFECRK